MKKILIELQERLPNETLAKFLVCFAFNLTISARATYVPQEDTIDRPKALKGLNEISHQVLGHAMSVMNGETFRASPEAFGNVVVEKAKYFDCVAEMEDALSLAVERFNLSA